jgi:hypothetical protein
MREQRTVVSNDIVGTTTTTVADGGRVVLIPMAEWKQAGVRAIRSAVQFFVLLAGGGSVLTASSAIGLPPGVLPVFSTGNAYWDFVLLSLLAGLFVFIWNAVEFWFSVDRKAPEFRA